MTSHVPYLQASELCVQRRDLISQLLFSGAHFLISQCRRAVLLSLAVQVTLQCCELFALLTRVKQCS